MLGAAMILVGSLLVKEGDSEVSEKKEYSEVKSEAAVVSETTDPTD
jgi:hypothetical protein